jgi:hypothetical protein
LFAFAFAAGAFAAGFVAAFAALATVFAALAALFAAVAAWLAAFAIALAAVFIALATLLAFAVELLAALSPQAMPKAPSAKRLESAIIFFISKWTLLSFSKNILTYFYLLPPCERHCSETSNFGTIDNIVIQITLVNPPNK